MALKYIDQGDFQGKKVLCRFDFNVPLDKDLNITDSTRIEMALPTLRHLIEKGAKKLILVSHLGRPKGEINPKLSLEPVAAYLAEALREEVFLAPAPLDKGVNDLLNLSESKIVLLENIRFHSEEEANNQDFAALLASFADVYVNDAFGTAHRKHASTYAVNAYFKNQAFGGFLLKNEIEALNKVVESPKKPFVAVVGGAKISDKIKVIERLLVSVDRMLIGGAMAYPFLKARGIEIGNSLCQDEDVTLAKKILNLKSASKLELPIDHIGSKTFENPEPISIDQTEIPADLMALDIGPQTLKKYQGIINEAKTILWNGPMGLFESPKFSTGTTEMARMIGEAEAFSLVGGGDSVSAVKQAQLADKMGHVSTGGGASLEYLEEGSLPGINALKFGVDL